MLKWLKKSLSGDSIHNSTAAEAAPSIKTARLPAGFLPAESPDVLIADERRQQSLQIIQQVSSMPAPLYNTLCYQPLLALLARVQQVPAAETGVWARQGGFGDLTLKFTACAVRLSKGYMFPPGAAPEEQSAQSSAWNAVVFWSALFHHLPLLARLEGEQLNGECWMPGMTVPAQAYRCRFRKAAPTGSEAPAMASVMAGQLLPAEAVRWLSDTPPVLRNLAGALWNGHPEMPLIRDVLKQSAAIVDAPPMGSGSQMVQAGKLAAAPAPVPGVSAPPAELPASGELPVPALAPEMLLSELAPSVPTLSAAATQVAPAAPAPQVEENVADEEAPAAEVTPEVPDETDMLLSLFSAVPAEPEEHAEPPGAVPLPVSGEMSDEGQGEERVAQAAEPTDLPAATAELTEQIHSEQTSSPVEPKDHNAEGGKSTGALFLDWLSDGLKKNSLLINQPDGGIHLVSGYVFISVPDIFFNYGKATGDDSHRRAIQSSFERLGVHRVRGKERFSQARIYSSISREGKYRQLNGYLIKATALYRRGSVPEDSPYISFK